MKYHMNRDIEIMNAISKLIKESGSFEILNEEYGRYTLTFAGKTATADVNIDTYTYGCGLNSAEDAKKYEDLMNPIFLCVCTEIAEQLDFE